MSSSRVIVGVDAAIADAASLALMVESVGQGTDQWKDAIKRYSNIQIAYSYQLLSYSITLKVRSDEKIVPFRKISTQLLRVILNVSLLSHLRGQSCRISYTSSKEDMLAAGDLIMCRYVLRTEGFDTAGALR